MDSSFVKRPFVELSSCILCEICTDYCRTVFKMNAAGFVEVTELDDYPEEDVDEVIKNCPKNSISWEEL